MKHVKQISQRMPVRAASWQDLTCQIVKFVDDVLGTKGGNIPILDYLRVKCNIPT